MVSTNHLLPPRQMRWWLLAVFAVLVAPASLASAETLPFMQPFTLSRPAEAVATIAASCERCDWSVAGREAAVLRLDIDGAYSQHVLLTRGGETADYSVFLGPIPAGRHTLTLIRDGAGSASGVGDVDVTRVDVRAVDAESPDHAWLAEAPILHARAGTIDRFSDVPLASYVERLPAGRGYRYTIVFSHEDGGTPTDRLMATWGRATDIEFVYEIESLPEGGVRQEYQGRNHENLPFRGRRVGSHPLLWVATDNNMVSDTGAPDTMRFALTPQLIDLTNVSREAFMDANPWLYAVMRAELTREGRIDPTAAAGSGKIPDPWLFGYVEACGELRDATLALDLGIASGGAIVWHPSDRGDSRFRIARSGCFRAAVPLPAGTSSADLLAVRARAYTRPPRQGEGAQPPASGKATLQRVNAVFMLDDRFKPAVSGAKWIGDVEVPADGTAVVVVSSAK